MEPPDKVPVLIVDDHPDNLVALEAMLSDLGLELVRARSGNDALRQTLHTEFALVLLDAHMPEMDGFETAELMRSNPKTRQLPIIFITGVMTEEEHLFKGYESGAVDYLIKPINPSIVKGKVRVFCELFQQRRQMKEIQAELERQNERMRETYLQLQEETAQRVRSVEELRKQEQILIQQNRMAALGEMLSNIAHQWRQPLNVLGLVIQQIGVSVQLGDSPELVAEDIKKAMDVLLHLSDTIDDFRTLSCPDKEKVVFEVEQVMAKTLSLVQETFQEGGITLHAGISGRPKVHGFPNAFSQVLLNILMNAKDALTERRIPDGRITLSSWAEGERTIVTITDNAGGIEEGILDKIFDPYFTTKDVGKGTGLGLFMSKNIVEKSMGGRLSVRNVPGGAEFRLEL